MHKLKPCPFCGGVPEMDTLQRYRNIATGRMESAIAVYCTSCSADMSVCYADVPGLQPEQVADMWNKREMPVLAEGCRHMEELQSATDAAACPWHPMRSAPKDGTAILLSRTVCAARADDTRLRAPLSPRGELDG